MAPSAFRPKVLCAKHQCSGWCFKDVWVAGWDTGPQGRPNGPVKCRECGTRYPQPDASTKSAFAGQYALRYHTNGDNHGSTKSGLAPGVNDVSARRPPLGSKPLGGAPKPGSPTNPAKPTPWKYKQLEKENEELRKQVQAKSEGANNAEAQTKDEEPSLKQLREAVSKAKRQLAEADNEEETELFKKKLAAAEAKLQESKDKADASKPTSQRLREARQEARRLKADVGKQDEQQQQAAKDFEEAKAKAKAAEEKLEQLKNQQALADKKVADLEAEEETKPLCPKETETIDDFAARKLAAAKAALPAKLQPNQQEEAALLAGYREEYEQAKAKDTNNESDTHEAREAQQQQQAQGSKGDEVEDAEMEDADCDEQISALIGAEAMQQLAPEELEKKRTSARTAQRKLNEKRKLVQSAGLKAKQAKS